MYDIFGILPIAPFWYLLGTTNCKLRLGSVGGQWLSCLVGQKLLLFLGCG